MKNTKHENRRLKESHSLNWMNRRTGESESRRLCSGTGAVSSLRRLAVSSSLAALLAPLLLIAADYSIDWFTIDGGGGTSTGGVYSVSGTIGQPDAGQMSAGPFTLQGGFWSLYAVQTPGAPLLSIEFTNQVARVYWALPA